MIYGNGAAVSIVGVTVTRFWEFEDPENCPITLRSLRIIVDCIHYQQIIYPMKKIILSENMRDSEVYIRSMRLLSNMIYKRHKVTAMLALILSFLTKFK
jgi:hypothetical protein